MIRLIDVGFRYPGTDRYAVRDVHADVPAGGVLRIDGPNGAGKSTLLKLVLGLLVPTEGRIEGIAGRPLAAVFQDDRLIEHLSAIANVRLAARTPLTNDAITAEFTAIGLAEETWTRPVSELSGGQRRRVCLVRAVLASASVVTLDEPFTGIDADALPGVMDYVRCGLADADVLLVTHDDAQAAAFGGASLALPA